jgi:DNA polymerase-1
MASIVGMLSRLSGFVERFGTRHIVFCLDTPPYTRLKLFPDYKKKKPKEQELQEALDVTTKRIYQLREILPELAFKNVLHEEGLEADDMMARVATGLAGEDRVILISEDQDLYQLLSWRCAVYHPRKQEFVTAKSFKKEYDIPPNWWTAVKSIVGDESDNLPGVPDVGIKTAISFMHSTLSTKSKRRADIQKWITSEEYKTNLKLVTLPFSGEPIHLFEDNAFSNDLVGRYCKVAGIAPPMTMEDHKREVRGGGL